jgi:nicotinamidase-related amidase
LHVILRSGGIRGLILTGAATNVCAESTVREGYFINHYIVVVNDCCTTNNEGRNDLTAAQLHR